MGKRISARRKAAGLSQANLARQTGISASYLNLIESNKRQIGGSLLRRIAEQLGLDVGELSGEAEHRLIAGIEEAFADPLLSTITFDEDAARDLVAEHPTLAVAFTRIYRAYLGAVASADDYANRLRADPMFSQLLHKILSGVTVVRSGAEILEQIDDLNQHDRIRFVRSIGRETQNLGQVTRTLINQFEGEAGRRRSTSAISELDDVIFENDNYFPRLECIGEVLRLELSHYGAMGEQAAESALHDRFGVTVAWEGGQPTGDAGPPSPYSFDRQTKIFRIRRAVKSATRQFQLVRLFAELSAGEAIAAEAQVESFTSDAARALAASFFSSYLASTIVFPYDSFLRDAQEVRYDIELLRRLYNASFEQVAHRLVTLRKPGSSGVPFGLLRSDPAGRLTKHFPLPGLLLPSSGHACPLWAIYDAFRTPDVLIRQMVRFSDGSRYMFLAKASARAPSNFGEHTMPTSVMIACDALYADQTVYSSGINTSDLAADVLVGPTCRLCARTDCAVRQEAAMAITEAHSDRHTDLAHAGGA